MSIKPDIARHCYVTSASGLVSPKQWGARNGLPPPGEYANLYTAEYVNALLAGRVKLLFTKWIDPSAALNLAADTATWRFACHTSPLAKTIRIRMILAPMGSTHGAAAASEVYWVSETGLTGAGTTTTHASAYLSRASTTSNTPNDWSMVDLDCTVTGDTDYRFTLHQVNGAQVLAATAYGLEHATVDPSTETTAVDTTQIRNTGPIYDSQYLDIATALDKLWKRQGAQLGTYSVDKTTAITRTSATYANAWDGSTAYAAYSATPTTTGWIVYPEYRHDLDATSSAVNVTGYCYASMAGGGTGHVRFVGASGTLATINVTGAAAWYSTTFTLDGTTATDKIDVHINGDGANAVSLFAAGCFVYDS